MLTDDHSYVIRGGKPLIGTVKVSGAKNAVTKQMVATLLTDEECTLHNVPRIKEVDVVCEMLKALGADVHWTESHTLTIRTESLNSSSVLEPYSGINRIPILMLGPILHRLGEVSVPTLGGCNIGARPVDFHLDALRSLGAEFVELDGRVSLKAEKLKGSRIRLAFPSVGATESILLSSCLAQGTTVVENAAVEPEVLDTIDMLQKMGALIDVGTERTITIEGVGRLNGVSHRSINDRIEAASFAACAVATAGNIDVLGAEQQSMSSFLNYLRRIGGGFEVHQAGIRFFRERPLSAAHVETSVHPGLMTDWQQPLVVLLTQAKGASVVHETVYEQRFGYAEQINSLGAQIELTSACLGNSPCRYNRSDYLHSAVILGPSKLRGGHLNIPDLRAGFAYVLAALVAEGTSTITGTRYLERGYEDPVGKLRDMGADIELVPPA